MTIRCHSTQRAPKKCLKDDKDEDHMAITHHDDLELIKDVVRSSHNVGLIVSE